jgi:hypothetical protein
LSTNGVEDSLVWSEISIQWGGLKIEVDEISERPRSNDQDFAADLM